MPRLRKTIFPKMFGMSLKALVCDMLNYSLSTLFRNYCDVFSEILFHHRVTENTETLFLFAHRETAMGKKICTFGDNAGVI